MPISTTSAYQTAAARPNRVPVFLFQIEDYHRTFSNADTSAVPFLSSPVTGQLTKSESHSVAGVYGPDLLFVFSPAGAYASPGSDDPSVRLRSEIDKVYAVVHAQAILGIATGLISGPWGPGYGVDISFDGGSTYPSGIVPTSTDLVADGGDFSLDITPFLGSLATFDFTQIRVRVTQASSTLVFASSSPAELDVSGLALVFTYNDSSDSYFMPFNNATVIPSWSGGPGWPPGTPDGAIYGTASFSASSLAGTFTTDPWLTESGIDDLQLTVHDLDGGADLADLVVHVQDHGANPSVGIAGGITQDFPTFVFEGKQVRLLCGWGHIDPVTGSAVSDLAFGDFATLFVGQLDSIESENANNDYIITCSDNSAFLSQVIFGTADDGFPTSSNHVRTLNGHPLDILLSILETELGRAGSDIDVATITTYRDTIYSGAQMQFTIESPPVAKDFIENELLKPLGAFRYTNNLGQFAVVFFYPISTTPVFDFTEDNVIGIPEAGQTDLINEVVTRFDADSQDFRAISVEQSTASVTKYGLYGSLTIESKGLRSGLNGFFFSAMTAFLIFLRYAFKALCHGDNGKNASSSPITALWSAALLNPGDFVTLTHSKVPDRSTGTMGISLKTYVVLDRLWQFFVGNAQYKMVEVDLSKFKQYLITGNGEGDYTGVGATDQHKYLFMCNDSDQYSNGDPANTLC